MSESQNRIAAAAEALLAALDEEIPSTTIHYAVEDARRKINHLLLRVDTIKTVDQ